MTTLTAQAAAWSRLPALPDRHGFAGCFAGVSGGSLIVAGGANFPEAPLAEGGTKMWHDGVFALDRPDGLWREVGRLPGPSAYGVSVSTDRGVLCIGGSDSAGHHRECFMLVLQDSRILVEKRPPLPIPLANMAGTGLKGVVYVIGGTSTPDDAIASRRLFALDLADPGAAWRELEPIPGEGRILPVAAVSAGGFHVVSGVSLAPDAAGKPVRTYLADTWLYQPGAGWSKAADAPHPVVAAPSPAIPLDANRFLVVGGDDGSGAAFKPGMPHPGFSRRLLAYDRTANAWSEWGRIPENLMPAVTAPSVQWSGGFVIASGEIKPGIRSPQVIELKP